MTFQLSSSESVVANRSPLRVLLVNYWYPPAGDGAEKQAHLLASGLVRGGSKVTVITARLRGLPTRETRDGVTILRLPCPVILNTRKQGIGLLVLVCATGLYVARNRKNIDVIHCQMGSVFTAATIGCGWLLRKTSVLRLAASGTWSELEMMRSGQHGFLGRMTFPLLLLANRVVALNGAAAREATTLFGPGRVDYVPNGIVAPREPWEISEAGTRRTMFGVTPGDRVVFGAGRLSFQKGFDLLIRACVGLPFTLVAIAGEGSEKASLEQLAHEQGVRLLLLGKIDQECVQDWMRAASVVVAPSRAEGMSNVVLEALALGCPVIASEIPGNTEIVENGVNGRLVQANDIEGLHLAIDSLLDAPLVATRMGANARKSIQTSYSIEKMVHGYEAIYQQVIDKTGVKREIPIRPKAKVDN